MMDEMWVRFILREVGNVGGFCGKVGQVVRTGLAVLILCLCIMEFWCVDF